MIARIILGGHEGPTGIFLVSSLFAKNTLKNVRLISGKEQIGHDGDVWDGDKRHSECYLKLEITTKVWKSLLILIMRVDDTIVVAVRKIVDKNIWEGSAKQHDWCSDSDPKTVLSGEHGTENRLVKAILPLASD